MRACVAAHVCVLSPLFLVFPLTQLEMQGEYQEAINFYANAGCYNHSIRLARGHRLDAELMR